VETALTILDCLSLLAMPANLGHWLALRRCGLLVWPAGWTGVLIKSWIIMSITDRVITVPASLHNLIDVMGAICMLIWGAQSIHVRRRGTAAFPGVTLTAQQAAAAGDRP
jgi:hypothetical protein